MTSNTGDAIRVQFFCERLVTFDPLPLRRLLMTRQAIGVFITPFIFDRVGIRIRDVVHPMAESVAFAGKRTGRAVRHMA